MDTFTARTPLDLLALVPIVIGFHPQDSVVLLTFDAPARRRPGETVQARVDLPVSPEHQQEVAAMLAQVAERRSVHTAAVVLYTDHPGLAASFAALLVPALQAAGTDVIDVLRVQDQRFYAVLVPDEDGTPFDLADHAFTSGRESGRIIHPSREALAASLDDGDPDDAAALAAAAHRHVDGLMSAERSDRGLGRLLAEQAHWVRTTVLDQLAAGPEGPGLGLDDTARLLLLLCFDSLREVAWVGMERANARAHIALWTPLVRRAPLDLRAGVASLLAFAAWLDGDGALAWCAIDRTRAADPDDVLAGYLACLLESATPPTVWAPRAVDTLPVFGPLIRRRTG